MNRRSPCHALAAGLLALVSGLGAFPASAVQGLNEGLVTAMDRIGGNLLGDHVFDAVAQPIPDDGSPAPLRLYVATNPPNPVEFVLPVPDDGMPIFRATVGTDGSLTVEWDSSAAGGRLFPEVVAADLSGVLPAPDDGEPQQADFNDGLVMAMDRVGGNLLGDDVFDASAVMGVQPCYLVWVATDPPNPVEFVVVEPIPDDGMPIFRATVGTDGSLTLEWDNVAGSGRLFPGVVEADLSSLGPAPAD